MAAVPTPISFLTKLRSDLTVKKHGSPVEEALLATDGCWRLRFAFILMFPGISRSVSMFRGKIPKSTIWVVVSLTRNIMRENFLLDFMPLHSCKPLNRLSFLTSWNRFRWANNLWMEALRPLSVAGEWQRWQFKFYIMNPVSWTIDLSCSIRTIRYPLILCIIWMWQLSLTMSVAHVYPTTKFMIRLFVSIRIEEKAADRALETMAVHWFLTEN